MNISSIGLNNNQRINQDSSAVRSQTAERPASIDTSDKVQKGEDPGIFSGLKKFVRNNITGNTKACQPGCGDFTPSGSFLKKSAVAGTVVGGAAGFVIGYATTETDVSKMPLQTADINWKEPVMTPRYSERSLCASRECFKIRWKRDSFSLSETRQFHSAES
jgi:hypothetical protein